MSAPSAEGLALLCEDPPCVFYRHELFLDRSIPDLIHSECMRVPTWIHLWYLTSFILLFLKYVKHQFFSCSYI